MIFRSFKRFIVEAFKGIKRNALMSMASIGAVFFTLLLLAIVLLINLNINYVIEDVENQLEIAVYILDEVPEENIEQMVADTKNISNVTDVVYVSKEEALQMMNDRMGGESAALLESIDGENNPLPRFLRVKVSEPESINPVAEKIERMDGIERVVYGQGEVDTLLNLTGLISSGGMALMIFLGFVSVFIINNTIKLTVASRRTEISIMRYVGAKGSYIGMPFLLEGVLIGFIGSIFAMVIIYFGYDYVLRFTTEEIPLFSLMPLAMGIPRLLLYIVLGGALLGGLGSVMSLRKYLKV